MIAIHVADDPVGYAAAAIREVITCNRQECTDFPRQHIDFAERCLETARDVINGEHSH